MEILIAIAVIIAAYLFIRKYRAFKPDYDYKNKMVAGLKEADVYGRLKLLKSF